MCRRLVLYLCARIGDGSVVIILSSLFGWWAYLAAVVPPVRFVFCILCVLSEFVRRVRVRFR